MRELNLKITFRLDGTGVYYDPAEPPMFDAILACMRARFHVHGDPPSRDELPVDIPLPLKKWDIGGHWGWHASALFPAPECEEQLVFWRKRFRQNRVGLTAGSPNLQNGSYREWNTPLPLLLTPYLQAWCVYTGDRKLSRLRKDLVREVKWIGKKRAHGRGRVVGVELEQCDQDYSLIRNGVAARYLPDANGTRIVRPRPPYWNNCNAIPCTEILQAYDI